MGTLRQVIEIHLKGPGLWGSTRKKGLPSLSLKSKEGFFEQEELGERSVFPTAGQHIQIPGEPTSIISGTAPPCLLELLTVFGWGSTPMGDTGTSPAEKKKNDVPVCWRLGPWSP